MSVSFSAKVILGKQKKDGSCPIYLQVIINRQALQIHLDICWPTDHFDIKTGLCKKRKKDDPDFEDNNKLILKKLGKANEVAGNFRWQDKHLTKDVFLLEFNSELSGDDFIIFMEHRIEQRARRKQIAPDTKKSHTDTLRKLKDCFKTLPFYRINYQFPENFTFYLKTHIKARNQTTKTPSQNSYWGHHKNVKTYLNFAKKEKIKFDNPYEDYQVKTAESTWKALDPEQLRTLEKYYETTHPGTTIRRVLQKFLFSCHSSLRVSDLSRVNKAELKENILIYKPFKGFSKKGRTHALPLTQKALKYLQDSESENQITGFWKISDQQGNKFLKAIARQLKIPEEALHWHVGRETFATEALRKGMPLEILQKFMDHSKISDTMRYVTIHEERKRDAVEVMNRFNEAEEKKPA